MTPTDALVAKLRSASRAVRGQPTEDRLKSLAATAAETIERLQDGKTRSTLRSVDQTLQALEGFASGRANLPLEDSARIDASTQIARAILVAICDELKSHGPDPQSRIILAAGVFTAMHHLRSYDPNLVRFIKLGI